MIYEILYFSLPLILTLSLIFAHLTHPLSMGVTLLIQTILICLLTGLFNPCFWFSYILFLIFLGGMLILFIYVASLASNEPFKLHFLWSSLLGATMFFSLYLLWSDPLPFLMDFFLTSSEMTFQTKMNFSLTSTSTLFASPSFYLTSFMIMYLLLTLLVAVKIMSLSSGPLRPSST
uniref:NADH-ubiquinone oxidoreductase chain 6 n=1 Tax=Engaeus cunicularius TaxID=99757 RepID=W9A206_9EUCA|nr:NADH dehydrogenase subunit 6 [Engaeus cunicularius]CDN85539.1 NADH dehydrogenase subunit 6 [Engaeus cunicularius]